jgi:hypothetical protein
MDAKYEPIIIYTNSDARLSVFTLRGNLEAKGALARGFVLRAGHGRAVVWARRWAP